MPELPDITIYLETLEQRILREALIKVRIASPFLLRTAVPPIERIYGRKIVALRRIGKRIGFGFEGGLWLVLHLMIGGRLQLSIFPRARCYSRKRGRKSALRCTWSREMRLWLGWLTADWKSKTVLSKHNAYSDEILHRARLSPVALTQKLSHQEIERLHRATQEAMMHWINLLRKHPSWRTD